MAIVRHKVTHIIFITLLNRSILKICTHKFYLWALKLVKTSYKHYNNKPSSVLSIDFCLTK